MAGLRIDIGLDGLYASGREVEQLRYDRRRAKVYGDSPAFARREPERRLVGQHDVVELRHFDGEVLFDPAQAGQSPSRQQSFPFEDCAVLRAQCDFACEQLHFAVAANSLAAAGEFDAQIVYRIAEQRPPGYL